MKNLGAMFFLGAVTLLMIAAITLITSHQGLALKLIITSFCFFSLEVASVLISDE